MARTSTSWERNTGGYWAICPRTLDFIPPTPPGSSSATPLPSSACPNGRQLLDLVGLADAADKKLKTFSGGMRQRVGIAVAMLTNPKLLLLDEPTAGLDPRERVRFRNLIHALAADRIVILSTHIVSDIETIAGQIVMFKDHKLYCCDSPAKICAQWKGKVWQVPAEYRLSPEQLLLSEGQSEDGPVLRILSDMPPAGAVSVTPSLEDAFLAIYREEGRV